MSKPDLKILQRLYAFGGLMAYRVEYFSPSLQAINSTPDTFNEAKAKADAAELRKNGFHAWVESYMINFDGAFAKKKHQDSYEQQANQS